MLDKLLQINQRYVFLLVAVVVALPMLLNVELPIVTSPPVEALYKQIESLPPDSRVILSIDYDPASEPELQPMAEALLRHCFARNIRVFGMTLLITGQNLGAEVFAKVSKEFGYDELAPGTRYVYAGWRAGPVILQIGEDIIEVFQTDFNKNDLREMPMMKGVRNLDSFELCISLTGSNVGMSWINYPGTKYGKKIGLGVTGVLVANFYPYLQSGQLVGMLPALKGAAEYEKLINRKGRGQKGMGAQSAAHILIIFLIVVGNIIYFMKQSRDAKMGL